MQVQQKSMFSRQWANHAPHLPEISLVAGDFMAETQVAW